MTAFVASIRNAGRRLVLLTLATLVVVAATPRPGLSKTPATAPRADGVSVVSDGARLRIESPFLHLELNLRRPALDVLRYAPAGNGFYGGSVGVLVDEATAGNRQLRSWTDDPDGAQVSWANENGAVAVRVEGIDNGPLTRSNWTIRVAADTPTVRIERVTHISGSLPVESTGLAVISQGVPSGTDPTSLARILNGGAYRVEVGPAVLEQQGGVLGMLAVDNPELSYTASTDQPDRVAARQEGPSYTSSAFVRWVPPQVRGGELRENITFRLGWDNDFLTARSDYAPELENRLLASGYYGNAVIAPELGTVLSASMRDYRGSVWSRDTDYALQGYSYVLDDMSVFRNTLVRFLERIDRDGVAPEYLLLNGQYGNRESWDSMANVAQAMYTYVSKTGDLDFYREHEGSLKRAMAWIRALDTNNDGLPDRDVFPYGYTDTVENGPMHTYAIAKFYAAFLALAELDEAIGKDPRAYREYARAMQNSFKRPVASGGYWNPDTGYPIAWKRASGQVVSEFETFGIFEAVRVGLMTDPAQLGAISAYLDANRGAFVNGNSYPERLIIGGYDLSVKKAEVPMEKLWIMDCNAPWITGISVPARVRLGRIDDAREMLAVYATSANRSTPHAEFGAGPPARYGAGETADGGRLWDNWSWFSAVYGTHFGLKMTPNALEVAPAPLDPAAGRRLSGVTYQGASVQMEIIPSGYRLKLSAAKPLVLRPPAGYRTIDVNGDGNVQPVRTITAAPGATYVIQGHR